MARVEAIAIVGMEMVQKKLGKCDSGRAHDSSSLLFLFLIPHFSSTKMCLIFVYIQEGAGSKSKDKIGS